MRNYIYADFITRLNNAKRQHFKFTKVDNSNKILATLKIFYDLGIIANFGFFDNRTILVNLKSHRRRSVFRKLKLISTPGKRVYVDLVRLAKLKDKSNCSFYIISTNQGLKTDFECYMEKLCGEVLLKIEL
jgi:ribosomal protein S8